MFTEQCTEQARAAQRESSRDHHSSPSSTELRADQHLYITELPEFEEGPPTKGRVPGNLIVPGIVPIPNSHSGKLHNSLDVGYSI